MNKLSKRSLSRLEGVNPLLIAIAVDAVKESPYDFGIAILGGKRTAEEQRNLFERGKSNCDGFTNKSYHQSGNAFDIVCYKDGAITWDKDVFTAVAEHIKKIALQRYGANIKWGGDWVNFKDMPHFQI